MKNSTATIYKLTRTCQIVALGTIGYISPFASPIANAQTIASGSIANNASQAKQDRIKSASIAVDGASNVTLTVHYDVATFAAGLSFTTFYLDFGKGHSTRWEAIFEMPSYTNPFARVLLWDGSKYNVNATNIAFTTLKDGYTCTMPLKSFGATTPPKNFTLHSQRALSAGSSTRIEDQTGVGTVESVSKSALAPSPNPGPR